LTAEKLVTSATGGRKNRKAERYDLIPAEPLRLLAEHFGKGAEKYTTETESGDRNWERGYPMSLNFAALQRHIWQWWAGEDLDKETGTPHTICAAWHALVLTEFLTTHPEFDDRPKKTNDGE
jgi:hypothetical protein